MPTCSLSEFHYYEIEVLVKSTDKEGQGIGLVSGNCEAFVYPGWTAQTIGYHNDDGSLYVNGDDTEREYTGYNRFLRKLVCVCVCACVRACVCVRA